MVDGSLRTQAVGGELDQRYGRHYHSIPSRQSRLTAQTVQIKDGMLWVVQVILSKSSVSFATRSQTLFSIAHSKPHHNMNPNGKTFRLRRGVEEFLCGRQI